MLIQCHLSRVKSLLFCLTATCHCDASCMPQFIVSVKTHKFCGHVAVLHIQMLKTSCTICLTGNLFAVFSVQRELQSQISQVWKSLL